VDSTNKIIKYFEVLEYKKIKIVLNDGTVVFSDLKEFDDVYCFPTEKDWNKISIDNYGRGLIWSTRFEVHIDQIIDSSYSVEKENNAG
jgi:hypothetical protein